MIGHEQYHSNSYAELNLVIPKLDRDDDNTYAVYPEQKNKREKIKKKV